MSNSIQLDSAAAVEVAAFCWPDTTNSELVEHGYKAAIMRRLNGRGGEQRFDFSRFDHLHRACAVLVGRGAAERLNRKLIGEWNRTRDTGPHTNDYMAWLLSANAASWARAILATVREVKQ